ncbi:MAG: L-histidine N(alpha)-methyltransferase [Balneolaceae bacterium]
MSETLRSEKVEDPSMSMREEILIGLRKPQKEISSKYFYDQRGSELFEEICRQEEYYPTDTEISIMNENIDEIAHYLGSGVSLIELGSGSSYKTRLLLDHLPQMAAYIPVDISEEFLNSVANELQSEYQYLQIDPVAADYSRPFTIPEVEESKKRVIYFPGSTIGNFTPVKARRFLNRQAKQLNGNDGLLIGVDRKKDPEILNAAYNDKNGVTAAFNKNLLIRLNRVLDADFNPDLFEHYAFYNEELGRIEMHLVSKINQTVTVAGEQVEIMEGETIHTENSYKYSPEEFIDLASDQFQFLKIWSDDKDLFSVYYFNVTG